MNSNAYERRSGPLTILFQDTQFPLIRVSPACVPGQRRLACDGRATQHRAGVASGIHGRRSLRDPDPFTYDTIADVLLTLEYTALQIGFWELTLPNDQQTQDRLKNGVIENVLLAITYAGRTRCGLIGAVTGIAIPRDQSTVKRPMPPAVEAVLHEIEIDLDRSIC